MLHHPLWSKLSTYAPSQKMGYAALQRKSQIRKQDNPRICDSSHLNCSAGAFLNFDLAYPSSAIPDDFFPSDVQLYGYSVCLLVIITRFHILMWSKDFGIWNITYEEVSCTTNWAGGQNAAALGSVPSQGLDACCPADPTVSLIPISTNLLFMRCLQNSTNTCPSYSEQNGIPCVYMSSRRSNLANMLTQAQYGWN